MGDQSYYDFAENDYHGLEKSIDSEIFYTGMASNCQSVCERYLKYLIKTCLCEDDFEDIKHYTFVMKTHSLKVLCREITQKLPDCRLDAGEIYKADGFYFSSRYPGEDAFIADKDEILYAWQGVKACKRNVDEYLASH